MASVRRSRACLTTAEAERRAEPLSAASWHRSWHVRGQAHARSFTQATTYEGAKLWKLSAWTILFSIESGVAYLDAAFLLLAKVDTATFGNYDDPNAVACELKGASDGIGQGIANDSRKESLFL